MKAGDNVAVCDEYLHMEVRFNGQEINPLEFLTMVRDNLVMENQKQMSGNNPEVATLDFDVHTPYDEHEKELNQMYSRFFGTYMKDMLFQPLSSSKRYGKLPTRHYTIRFTLRCLLRAYSKYAEPIRFR